MMMVARRPAPAHSTLYRYQRPGRRFCFFLARFLCCFFMRNSCNVLDCVPPFLSAFLRDWALRFSWSWLRLWYSSWLRTSRLFCICAFVVQATSATRAIHRRIMFVALRAAPTRVPASSAGLPTTTLVGGPGPRPCARPGCGGARLCFYECSAFNAAWGCHLRAQIYVPRCRLSSCKALEISAFCPVAS